MQDNSASCLAELQRCSAELTAIFFCYCTGNVTAVDKLFSLNMQDGTCSVQPPSDEERQELLVHLFVKG